MKMIQATVESFRQGDVAEALRETAASGATISTLWSGEPPVACVRFDVVVHDDLVDRVVDAVVRGARAGKGRPTRGSVLVVPVLEALRIRTGEIDEAAIA